jgi:hypothetical protein
MMDWSGLVLNFTGVVIIALSIGKPRGGGPFMDDRSKINHLAVVNHPWLFKFGLGTMALGYLLQIVSPWFGGE